MPVWTFGVNRRSNDAFYRVPYIHTVTRTRVPALPIAPALTPHECFATRDPRPAIPTRMENWNAATFLLGGVGGGVSLNCSSQVPTPPIPNHHYTLHQEGRQARQSKGEGYLGKTNDMVLTDSLTRRRRCRDKTCCLLLVDEDDIR